LSAILGAGRPDEIRLPLPRHADKAATHLDREVVLGVRPECIGEAGRFAGGPAASITGLVDMNEPTGAETIVLARFAGEKMRARIAPDLRLPVGGAATFAIDTRTICLFDPVTEQLIA
jgi:multiple sugar transport system ATP-binding protein